MRLFARRDHDDIDRRRALEGIPVINPGVKLENDTKGNSRVCLMLRRGSGIFDWMRPKESPRSYDLDEFGTFVIGLVDGKKTVLELINAFEERFKLSRRETELSVIAFLKLLMQRHVLSVTVEGGKASEMAGARMSLAPAALLLGFLLSAFGSPSLMAESTPQDTMKAIAEIAKSSRAPGTPGNLALQQMVEKKFRESGVSSTNIISGNIEFNCPTFESGFVEIDLGPLGQFHLDAMHPALMRPGNFKEDQFESPLVYLGKGDSKSLAAAKGVSLNNAIAVMDYDCGDQWLDLYSLGIRGFFFIGDGSESHFHSTGKVYQSEVAVPRFFIGGKQGQRLKALVKKEKELFAKVKAVHSKWKSGVLKNPWALIDGSDEELKKKVVVLTATLDANSVVPAFSYGAQRAMNLHLLLELFEEFKKNPPKHSVMLVAVNAQTRLYTGRRLLAWHLLADIDNVEQLRKGIEKDMRIAELHASKYGSLKLDPVPEGELEDLNVMIDVMWSLDRMQEEKLKEEKDPSTIELFKVSPEELEEALRISQEETKASFEGWFGKGSRSEAELEIEKLEALAQFDKLKSLGYKGFMAKAANVLSVFEDEKLFESWRSEIDDSIPGERIYVKTKLQDEFMSLKNRTTEELMVTSSTKMSDYDPETRERLSEELRKKKSDFTKVLVLFNKMDIGVGRSRTYYRTIAGNVELRPILKSAVDRLVEKYTRYQEVHQSTLERDSGNEAIRDALGARTVGLVLPLELDAHGEKLGLQANRKQNAGGAFKEFGALAHEIATEIESERGTSLWVDALSGESSKDSYYYFSDVMRPLEHYEGASAKTPAISLNTAFANKGRTFSPYDRVSNLDTKNVHQQVTWAKNFLLELCSHEEALSPKKLVTKKEKSIAWGINVRTFSLEQFVGKPIPTKEIGEALVCVYRREYQKYHHPAIIDGDVVNCYSGISNSAGSHYVRGIVRFYAMAPLAYSMNEDFNEILYTIDKGRIQSSKQINSNIGKSIRATLPLFECREFVIRERNDPTKLGHKPIEVRRFWPKTAEGQSDPQKYGVHGAYSLSPARSHRAKGPVGIYLYRKRAELRQDKLMVITEDRRCILGGNVENPSGDGFSADEDFPNDPFLGAALDMSVLNKSRTANMKGVVNQMLDEFLERGEQLNSEAEEKLAQGDHLSYLSTRTEALGTSVKAYQELRGMNDDMLKAIIAYMALMIPFCYFLQKLMFNFTRMEHELAGFSLFFFSIFLLFRFIHPAFRIAMSPEAIFIAFVLGAIGFFTTAVLHSRFSEEMKLLFRGVGGFGENAGAGTIGQTAVMIGVQNMRRRKVRTTLTTATIILVVFTMLAFSSVSKTASPSLIPQSETSPYTGLFYHWPSGGLMDEASYRVLSNMYGETADVQPRRVIKRQTWQGSEVEEKFRLELKGQPEISADIKSISGITPNDVILQDSMAIIEGSTFSSLTAKEILLPVPAADALGLSAGNVGKTHLKMLGEEWLLVGLLDDQRYRMARDLNPSLSLVPMVSPPKTEEGEEADSLEMDIPEIDKILMETAELAVIPEGAAKELRGKVSSISVVFPDSIKGDLLSAQVQRLLAITDTRFFFGSRVPFKLDPKAKSEIKPGTYYVGSGYRTAIGGLTMLIIPLIIAGSIVLNTMLGTVYERKSEIGVFNAIGLNPTHIFTFFLAEAFVYSLLGAVGGYLIGQILAMGLKETGLVQGVNINFSSMMVVYAIAFTMGLVMLSTIYPGWVATRVAVPSGKRKWSMPDHDSNTMDVVFPFIYGHHLAPGAMVYLHHFFDALSDQSMGDIVAKFEGANEEADEEGKPIRTLTYTVALAPYDLGVTQRVIFTNSYDDHVRSYRMQMRLERISGQETNWVTTNKPFLERLRKYLIRWRNIDPTRQHWYVEQADTLFEKDADVVRG